MNSMRDHWEQVYRARLPEERSWFQPQPAISLDLIALAGVDDSARIIDVGGGTSHLVDALSSRGYKNVTVLDISSSALEEAKQRLGTRAGQVQWVEADVTSGVALGAFDVWHDRAVFHFLIDPRDRAAYVHALENALDAGGHAIIATFAEDGPSHCSGLPVLRHSPPSLLAELGPSFSLVEIRKEQHRTPAGRDQSFVYSLFRRSEPKDLPPNTGMLLASP